MIKNKIVIIAPHPDDETLGCGGTILRHVEMGDEVHWVIVTGMSEKCGFSPEKIAARKIEIEKVGSLLGIEKIHEMGYPPARLDSVAKSELVEKAGEIIAKVEPNIIFAPYWGISTQTMRSYLICLHHAQNGFVILMLKRFWPMKRFLKQN